jgi:hypothetical protein
MFNSQESWLLKNIQFEGEPGPGGQGKGTVKLTTQTEILPQTTGVLQFLNRRTSPLSNLKKPGLGGVDGERP